MKTVLLCLFTLAMNVIVSAQTLEEIKSMYKAAKTTEAKTAIDKYVQTPANQNAAAFYLKAKIYNAVAADPALSLTYPDARRTAFTALKTYTEKDDKMLIDLQIDGYKTINDIYTGAYQAGASAFDQKNYSAAYSNFLDAIKVSGFMDQKGWIKMPLDTNSVLYAGVSAEKLSRFDDAALQYSSLANARLTGDGFVEIYKWLANYYYEKKDLSNARKYSAIGREVYPSDSFWPALDLDMLRGEGDKNKLFAGYEKVIAADPGNHLYRYNYAVELYGEAYNADAAKRPANSAAMIDKAFSSVKEALRLKPEYARAQLFAGQIIYNQGVDLNSMSKQANAPSDSKTKAVAKFKEAEPYFLAVERLLEPKGKLKKDEKDDLKEAYDLLITIYDQQKLEAKAKEYEVKFSDIDKKH